MNISEARSSGNVIVFKGDDETKSIQDPYVIELEKLNLNAKLIPALKFEFYNLNSLQEKLSSPGCYSGIVFSSPRCVQAVEQCRPLLNWSDHTFFCVGSKTASLVQKLGANPIGEDCGNAAALAEFILKNYSHFQLPLLIPHGNLSLKTLTNTLSDGGINVECVEVYRTVSNPGLVQLIKEYFEEHSKVDFVIYMSPSAVSATLHLFERFQDVTTIKFVSIGPTTASCLEALNIKPAGVAEKPTPQYVASVLSKIISVDKKS